MANRYAPYKVRTLTREPRRLYVKFTSNGTTGEQTLANTEPFNMGVVNVVASATGIYKVALGASATQRDSYAHFAGIQLMSDDVDMTIGEVTNVECNSATDPNVTFQTVQVSDGADSYVANTKSAYVIIDFLDSKD